MSLKGLGFKRLVPPPLDSFKGIKFTVIGSWWPSVLFLFSTTGKDKNKEFTLRVLDVDLKHVKSTSAPGTKGSPHFMVQLVDSADPDSTGVGALVEGENCWWVSHEVLSDAYYADKEKKDGRSSSI
jgi:hypothetical protein